MKKRVMKSLRKKVLKTMKRMRKRTIIKPWDTAVSF